MRALSTTRTSVRATLGPEQWARETWGALLILGKGTERINWAFLSGPHCFCVLGIPGLQKQALG